MYKALAGAVMFAGVVAGTAAPAQTAAERARIDRILKATPLIDGHNDLPWELRSKTPWPDLRANTAPLHTDIPRLRQGRVGAQFWSVWIPTTFKGDEAVRVTLEQIDIVRRMAAQHPETFVPAATAADIRRIHKSGRIASLIGVEGGHQIANSLPVLRQFHALGVRYMTLTHSTNTEWADSATDEPKVSGLTDRGREIVAEMNRIGMILDLSHVSAKAALDALAATKAPVIFSHSNARALNDHPRNVPDDVLKRLPANGGVVMVNFFPTFVSARAAAWSAARTGEEARLKALDAGQPGRAKAGLEAWEQANPRPVVPIGEVADHIEHIVKVAGHDHVGIGSDYDGISSTVQGLEGVDTYPALFAELIRRGWSDANLAKLAGGNVLRVMERAEAVAAAAAR